MTPACNYWAINCYFTMPLLPFVFGVLHTLGESAWFWNGAAHCGNCPDASQRFRNPFDRLNNSIMRFIIEAQIVWMWARAMINVHPSEPAMSLANTMIVSFISKLQILWKERKEALSTLQRMLWEACRLTFNDSCTKIKQGRCMASSTCQNFDIGILSETA